ncbi:DEAD/DEAH box helicase [Orrella sp. JC864]|uniref:DEAD/DEAH box helicase n=1 Tax=Orrella sp. JC864 TaxID=3120298 RepID=UPI003009F6E3
MSFENLGLAPALLSALQSAGFDTPTPVQASAIPQALQGHDLMVSSQTGSGKTAAFMLPALHRIAGKPANKGRGVQVLVLTPTRELALQVDAATRQYGKDLADLRTTTVVGGMPYGAQLRALSRRVDVLVATPGRLIDHLNARRVDLSTVHTLVLDEADRMLDMGFIEDIEAIVSRTPAARQTLLFSATLDGTVARLAEGMMREPRRIEMAGQRDKHANITQALLYADDPAHKMRLLDHLLRDASLDQAIVFTSTKRGADDLADRLTDQGFPAAALHGDMNQRQRTRTLSQLQRGQLRILVATDVAARGIDVQGISHAVNFDLPMQAEDYVHRIGRTGRAGRSGLAFTLVTHAERHKVRRIEQYIGQPIPPQVIAGLEPTRIVRSGPPSKGGRRPGFGKPSFGKPGYGKPGGYGRPEGESGSRGGYGKPAGEFGQRSHYAKPEGDFAPRPHYGKPGGEFGHGAPRQGRDGEGRPAGAAPRRPGDPKPSYGKPGYGKSRKPEFAGQGRPAEGRGPRPAGDRPHAPRSGGKPARRDYA